MTDQPKAAADIRPEPETVPPPPGWYDDESGNGKRWWNGKEWSDVRQTNRDAAAKAEPTTYDRRTFGVGGYIFAAAFPPIGFILGLIMLAKGDRDWLPVLLTSFVCGFVWLSLIQAMA